MLALKGRGCCGFAVAEKGIDIKMENQERNGFEKIFLAGVGALALTGDKLKELVDDLAKRGEITAAQSKAVIDDLVKRGEITAAQGKAVGAELKQSMKKAFACEKDDFESVLASAESFSDEEILRLREKLSELESAKSEQMSEEE